jgi:hypothetical protein
MNKKEIEKKLKEFGLLSQSWIKQIKGWFRLG